MQPRGGVPAAHPESVGEHGLLAPELAREMVAVALRRKTQRTVSVEQQATNNERVTLL
jgi:hypothetical protein